MANPIRRLFQDIFSRLGFGGRPSPPPEPPSRPPEPPSEPPFLGGGGSGGFFDDEIRWKDADKHNPAHYEVGSTGNPPSMGGINDLFDAAGDSDFYTVIIGGDEVKGDTGSLGGGPQWRGYKVQKDDLDRWRSESRNAEEFANRVAPPGRGWVGVHTIRVKDYNPREE